MSLEAVKEQLSKLEGGAALVAALDKSVQDAAEAALVETRRKLNKENESLRRRVKAVQEKFDIELDDPDMETKLDDLLKKASTGGDDGALARVNRTLAEVTKRLDAAEREKKELHRANILKDARQSITAALQAKNALRTRVDDLATLLLAQTEVNEDGAVNLRVGDTSMSIAEGVAKWLEPRKEFIESGLRPGAESGHNGGQGASPENEARMKQLAGSSDADLKKALGIGQ